MSESVRKRWTSAERTREYRTRRALGSKLIRLNISAEGASALVKLGWLPAGKERDPVAIAYAVLAIAGEAAGRGLRPGRAPART